MSEYMKRGRTIVQDASELFIDIDVEADGIAGKGSLLSIGAIDPWGETFYRELRPVDANGYIADYRQFNDGHGMEYDRLLQQGIDPARAMQEFVAWAVGRQERMRKVGGIALVGFNASYDFPLINLELVKAGIESPFGVAGYCIKSLAMGLRRDDYSWSQTSKGKLPREVLTEGDFTHHALDDARYQQLIHYGLVGMLR